MSNNYKVPSQEAFRSDLSGIVATSKQFFSLLTKAAVDAFYRYKQDGESDYFRELMTACQDENMSPDAIKVVGKFINQTTNLKIKIMDEEPFTVILKAKGESPQGWADVLSNVEEKGIRTMLGSNKSKRMSKSLNRNGEAAVSKIQTGAEGVSSEDKAKLTAEQQAAVDQLTEQYNNNLKLLMDGKPLPEQVSGGGGLPDLGDEKLNNTLQEIVALAKEVASTDNPKGNEKTPVERVAGALSGALTQLNSSRNALIKLAQKAAA